MRAILSRQTNKRIDSIGVGLASAVEARAVLLEFAEAFGAAATEPRTALAATDLAVDHRLQFWDTLIVMAAVDAGCALLLSEDIQDGFVARGMTIGNPFAEELHPKLASLLDDRN